MNMVDAKGQSGIYLITNLINFKVYVGKTNNFYKRYSQYKSDIKNPQQNRINQYLLNSFVKNGIQSFSFEVLELCDVDCCASRELFWIEAFDSTDSRFGYNLRKDSRTKMIVHQKTRDKISKRLKKEWVTGVRDGHSSKLRKSWENRDRVEQSERMSKTLTKYLYKIHYENSTEIVKYNELKELGYANVLCKFSKYKVYTQKFKNVIIERIEIEG